MRGYYTPKLKEIKEVMVPPLVHLSQTAPIPTLKKKTKSKRGLLKSLEYYYTQISYDVLSHTTG